jgi:hypothetical protein
VTRILIFGREDENQDKLCGRPSIETGVKCNLLEVDAEVGADGGRGDVGDFSERVTGAGEAVDGRRGTEERPFTETALSAFPSSHFDFHSLSRLGSDDSKLMHKKCRTRTQTK